MASRIFHVRFGHELVQRIEAYSKAKDEPNESLSIRRLVERGLAVSEADAYDMAKSLATLSTAVERMADRLGSIETDSAQIAQLVPDMKGIVDSLGEWTEEIHPHGTPFLKMVCEVLVAARYLVNKQDPEMLDKLGDYSDRQLQLHHEATRLAADAQPRKTPSLTAPQEG